MKLTDKNVRLYAVTDRRPGRDLIKQIEAALSGGVTILQLREKDMSEEEFIAEAKIVRELCKKYSVPFIINDSVEVAKTVDADGVHLGQDDMPIAEARKLLGEDKIIGISCHNVAEAVKAEADGADYLGSGAVFATSTKDDVTTLSKSDLREICESVKIPVVAIGGINFDNVIGLKGTKISGVAVASVIFASENAKEAAAEMKKMAESITEIKKVLTIAGSDSSGGAGIQADIKTITVHKMYAESVITALTAQNTTGVYGIMEASAEFVEKQMECVFEDIFPNAVKIGMVSNAEIIKTIAENLIKYNAKNIVVDPVMVSTSGSKLMSDDACECLINHLLPLADVITPNIPEAEVLSGLRITNSDGMVAAARIISEKLKGAVLIKGGHMVNDATDLLYVKGECIWFSTERIDNPNTHGTGCTLSSAIACNLADGYSVEKSIEKAKNYLTGAIAANLDLGNGSGPLEHTYLL